VRQKQRDKLHKYPVKQCFKEKEKKGIENRICPVKTPGTTGKTVMGGTFYRVK
jgi:hypothetical protein